MRYRVAGKALAVDTQHRLALRRNLARALFLSDRIVTMTAKAKAVRRFVERLITRAKKALAAKAAGNQALFLHHVRIVAAVNVPAGLIVGDDEVDAVILVRHQLVEGDIHRVPGRVRSQQVATQQSARLGRGRDGKLGAIGGADEQAVLVHPQPGSSRLGIDPGEHPRLTGLNRRNERRAVVSLFPVGRDQNRSLGNALVLNSQ